MNDAASPIPHDHIFLGEGHARSERKTWAVIGLCSAMMAAEILGGLLFGSIALVADGMHMSTHAGALLLAALAYSYARRHVRDPRFSFGTGKLGDLAGFTSAIILGMISLLIGYESVSRLFAPVPIRFAEALPIAVLGLAVNAVSAWLLSGGHDHGHGHGHNHGHRHDHGHHHAHGDAAHVTPRTIAVERGVLTLEIFEHGVPPCFRLRAVSGALPEAASSTIDIVRPDGARQTFAMAKRGDYLESLDAIPEPHSFAAQVLLGEARHSVLFEEDAHGHAHGPAIGHRHDHGAPGAGTSAYRDNNMRAAVVHVMADAAVSVLVIVGLLLARVFGWLWMDPLAGIVGALVIASWSYGLVRDTGAILLDMNADRRVAEAVRRAIESGGDNVADLHVWRLGPGHLGAIVSVVTGQARECGYYRALLAGFSGISHLTVEVHRA